MTIRVSSREIVDDIFMISECPVIKTSGSASIPDLPVAEFDPDTDEAHGLTAAYLIKGEETLLFDSISPASEEEVLAEIESILDGDDLDYVALSHPDTPHSGNVRAVLDAYPEATLVGPKYGATHEAYFLDTAKKVGEGDSIDLDGREVSFHYAEFMDSAVSMWMFEETTKTLFTVDWIGFRHVDGDCTSFVDDLSAELTVDHVMEQSGFVFFWFEYVDTTKIARTIDRILEKYQPEIIAPAHGLPIREDIEKYTDIMKEMTERVNESGRALQQTYAND